MNPEVERQLNEIREMVERLEAVENVAFIENLKRRVVDDLEISLSDLSDVSDTDSASTGQVLKKTSTTWQPGTDNTA